MIRRLLLASLLAFAALGLSHVAHSQAPPPEPDAPPDVSGWGALGAGDLLSALDGYLARSAIPSEGELAAVAKAVIARLSNSEFVAAAEPRALLALLDRLTSRLGKHYTQEAQAAVKALLEPRLAQSPEALSAATFDESLQAIWSPALRSGVVRKVVADAAAAWMEGNNWQSLPASSKARLARLLEDDKVSRLAYSVRWSGSLVAGASGEHVFSLDRRGGRARVVLGGELLLDSADTQDPGVQGDTDNSSRSAPKSLVSGARYPITVEYSFDGSRPNAYGREPEWLAPLSEGWSHLFLRVEVAGGATQVLSGAALEPPEGFAVGQPGLKRELFTGLAFSGEPEVELAKEVALALSGGAPSSSHRAKQRALVPAIMAQISGPGAQEVEVRSGAFVAARELADYLSLSEKREVMAALRDLPDAIANETAGELYHLQRTYLYLPTEVRGVIEAWCRRHRDVALEFGAFPTWDLEVPSYNHANYGGYWHMAYNLRSEEDLAWLRSALREPDGGANLSLARLGAFAHLEAGKAAEWRDAIAAALSNATLSGDRRATWLLARAFAEEVQRGTQSPISAKASIEDALAAAQSEAARLRALRELIVRFGAEGMAQAGRTVLESVRGQFGEPAQAEIDTWVLALATIEEFHQRSAREREAHLREEQIRELERRLAQAVEANDEAAIARFERLLEDLRR